MASRTLSFPAWDDAGLPKSGLLPTWDAYLINGVSVDPPADPAEVGDGTGLYETPEITLAVNQRLVARVDLGEAAYPRYWIIREQGAQWAAEDILNSGAAVTSSTGLKARFVP